MEPNFEGLEIQKWNIPTDRAHRFDEKNWVVCLVIMLTPRFIVIKTSKIAHFLYSLLLAAKHYLPLSKIVKCIWNISFSFFRKCHGLLGSELTLARRQPLKTKVHLNIFPKQTFWLPSAENKRMSHFRHFNDYVSESKHKN